jgi:hypothetical protein
MISFGHARMIMDDMGSPREGGHGSRNSRNRSYSGRYLHCVLCHIWLFFVQCLAVDENLAWNH